ncbi:RHS repeat-associated core domain-containing protein [Vreelandella aquamarina]|uniref:RHS repeat-associated core domain-containing protein n=1 Tax=Vreelandella aquamarina TaxID=77097 RepID=UPI003850653E
MNFRTQQQGRATDIVAYTYDAAGRLIERQQPNGERLTMGYDGANRLVNLTHASASGDTRDATYRYDGLGRRISKTVRHPDGTTATTHYGWEGDRIVREETDQKRITMVYEPDSFVPMLRIDDTPQGKVLSAYVTDALGTPMQLVNADGNTAQPIRFQGQWHDKESGLYYNRHRYYDPQQGRYISQDPIGLRGGMNHYNYAGNDPINFIDPKGLKTEVITFEGVGWGSSSFSHVATNIDDTIYSWGPNGMSIMPYQDYMERNTFRNAKGYTLNLSPGEQAQLEQKLMWQKGRGSYGALGFNCTDPLERGLEDLDYDLGINITPGSLQDSISASGLITNEISYGRDPNLPAPGTYQSAPWAGW